MHINELVSPSVAGDRTLGEAVFFSCQVNRQLDRELGYHIFILSTQCFTVV